MRTRTIVSLATAVLAAVSLHASQTTAPDALLSRAREALGGDRALSAITSFRVKGTVTVPGANAGQARGSFEIVCELPDRFVQTEDRTELLAGETVSADYNRGVGFNYQHARLGFVGNDLVYEAPAPSYMDQHPKPPAPMTPEARTKGLQEARLGFVNITLGMFAASFAGMPLTFGEAPEPDAVTVRGADLSTRLQFDPETHLPASLAQPILNPLTYADYRNVRGVKVPFRISNGRDTWTVKTFELNPKIDPKVFRPIVRAR